MKYIAVLLGALSLMACASSSEWRINTVAMEREVSNTLQLFPTKTDYRILIVPDMAAVSAEHSRIFGKPTNAPGFYAISENIIVIYRECEVRILRHEVGHAVVEAYFKEPVPTWLHEELAQRAERL